MAERSIIATTFFFFSRLTNPGLTWGPFSYVLATVFFEAIHGFGCGPLTSPLTGPESKFFFPEEITTPF